MEESFRIGRIAGVRVGANWTVLILFTLMVTGMAAGRFPHDHPGYPEGVYWAAGVATALVFYLSLLAHELGHAVMARRRGIPVEGITLWLLGGVSKMEAEPATPGDAFRVAAIGPAISLAAAGTFAIVAGVLGAVGVPALLGGMAAWLAGINVILAVFNLVPAAPLDGGRILQAFLWHRRRDRLSASVSAARAGRVFALVLVAAGIWYFTAGVGVGGVWLALLGWFLLIAARHEQWSAETRSQLDGVRVADVMTPNPVVVPGWLTVDAFIEDYALRHRFSSFPVERFDGTLDGLVTLNRLKEVPVDRREATRVLDVAWRMNEVAVTTPDAALPDLVGHMAKGGGGRALVVDKGRLVGIVSPTDVARALQREAFRRTGRPRPAADPGRAAAMSGS
ncbi:MAG TPA: site-2 protease family protein [Acidimicrobiales bacterium]|nr:site-2 protease family protein [Acidimicrobiales bacterium]